MFSKAEFKLKRLTKGSIFIKDDSEYALRIINSRTHSSSSSSSSSTGIGLGKNKVVKKAIRVVEHEVYDEEEEDEQEDEQEEVIVQQSRLDSQIVDVYRQLAVYISKLENKSKNRKDNFENQLATSATYVANVTNSITRIDPADPSLHTADNMENFTQYVKDIVVNNYSNDTMNEVKNDSNFHEFIINTLSGIIPDIDTKVLMKNMGNFHIAFTHKSANPRANYELYEYLGDSILDTNLINYLVDRAPYLAHISGCYLGTLDDLKKKYRSKAILSEFSQGLEFRPHINCSNNYLNEYEQDILEDVFESFVYALSLCNIIKSTKAVGALKPVKFVYRDYAKEFIYAVYDTTYINYNVDSAVTLHKYIKKPSDIKTKFKDTGLDGDNKWYVELETMLNNHRFTSSAVGSSKQVANNKAITILAKSIESMRNK